eukprot:TRINITY_DN41095_c0_g1_i1.p1 TRINITY_DN41095_c0_g1~~TRINITY_DN41095_c0_g1_i1.p1  ORF type:complete len:193 (+),score=36.61 TRINITY_DN41095_c0_g1_i1:204-782(+)
MGRRPDIDFEVRWLPFQLNPDAPQQPVSKVQAYMKKFGKSEAEVMQMADWMGQNFKNVGLPYSFTSKGQVANTLEAHRVLAAAYHKGGAGAQDKAAESLFHSYFAEEKAPNDPQVLRSAAAAAGLDADAVLSDRSIGEKEVREEMEVGRRLRVTGVPHFVVRRDGESRGEEVSGAQPPDHFSQIFAKVAGRG